MAPDSTAPNPEWPARLRKFLGWVWAWVHPRKLTLGTIVGVVGLLLTIHEIRKQDAKACVDEALKLQSQEHLEKTAPSYFVHEISGLDDRSCKARDIEAVSNSGVNFYARKLSSLDAPADVSWVTGLLNLVKDERETVERHTSEFVNLVKNKPWVAVVARGKSSQEVQAAVVQAQATAERYQPARYWYRGTYLALIDGPGLEEVGPVCDALKNVLPGCRLVQFDRGTLQLDPPPAPPLHPSRAVPPIVCVKMDRKLPLPVRRGPSPQSPQVGRLFKGTECVVSGADVTGAWYQLGCKAGLVACDGDDVNVRCGVTAAATHAYVAASQVDPTRCSKQVKGGGEQKNISGAGAAGVQKVPRPEQVIDPGAGNAVHFVR